MKTFLKRSATMQGGRNGKVKTSDDALDLSLSKPVEMGGDANGVDPENLFASGYAACLASSIEFLLQQEQKEVDDIVVTAEVSLVGDETGGFKFKLDVTAKIEGFNKATQNALLEKGLAFCPYSKAIKGNVEIDASIA